MRSFILRVALPVAAICTVFGCASRGATQNTSDAGRQRDVAAMRASAAAPPELLGRFEDDYRERHTITPREWLQEPRNRYHVLSWNTQQHYLIARNDSANAGDVGRFTRIDWVVLGDMAPYTWAFCFSSFNAPSAEAAEAVHVAKPDTPRTGCNGHPFTRMQRVAADTTR